MTTVTPDDAPGYLAETLSDFREGEIEPLTEARVVQFTDDVMGLCDWMGNEQRNAFLTGLATSIGRSYWSRQRVIDALSSGVLADMRNALVVFVQEDESSQATFSQVLLGECEEIVSGDSTPGDPVLLYVDDATFTGRSLASRLDLLADLVAEKSPLARRLIIFHLIDFPDEIQSAIDEVLTRLARLSTTVEFRSIIRTRADSLRNATLAPSRHDVELPIVQRFLKGNSSLKSVAQNLTQACNPGLPAKSDYLFNSEYERNIVTRAFLEVGIHIRFWSPNWNPYMRPLGYVASAKTPSFGFGTMFCSFHNSANTSPLALWWGDPTAPVGSALHRWNPLLPRRSQ